MRWLTFALILGAGAPPALDAAAQTTTGAVQASGPGGFVAAHGRRSAVMGYPDSGLEIWAYPLQLLSGYQVRFREAGRIAPVEGRALLKRIESRPYEIVRVYVGPDFVVREHIFTPLDAPGAVLTYEVEGRPDVQIEARFGPSLDLMWPGALGGQSVGWDDTRSGYVEREPLHGFNATIRSAEAASHDETVNSATQRPDALAMVLAPRREADGIRRARLSVAEDAPGDAGGALMARRLERQEGQLRGEAAAHYSRLLDEAVKITTPDPELNRALAASVVALDQAWVCAPTLGCGEVAGYGPSRPGRRPQYAWFFAGDGLVAVEGLLAAGLYERAREELAFITRYQDKANGMIWHEMSLSAPLIDWERRYPYMFVHVDITLQYLATLKTYLEATGDRAFLAAHWPEVAAAWRYSSSLIDPATRLPSIPPGKQGQNEQDALRDDVRLSSAWIDAADGFAGLARMSGRPKLAEEAERAARASREAVRTAGWDPAHGFWLGGHTAAGAPVHDQRSDAARILLQGAFAPAQIDAALDRLAGPDFQTDWGVRNLSTAAPDFDPNAYGKGSVWGLGTSAVATTFWKAHRPLSAWTAWHGLLAWTSLDSPGRLHEVMAGDLFHPEMESVPEQTWSSAGFLTGAMVGLLGIEPNPAAHALSFTPHLPGEWQEVSVQRLRVGASHLDLRMTESATAITLEAENDGEPVMVDFAPEIPLGARLVGAEVNGVSRQATVESHAQDQHARLSIRAARGLTRAVVNYAGGVRLALVEAPPRIGDASSNVKLGSASWANGILKIHAYVADGTHAIDLFTPMSVRDAEGADVLRLGPGRSRLVFHPAAARALHPAAYAPLDVVARLEDGGGS